MSRDPKKPVIPVLLPDASEENIPSSLRSRVWVDFRNSLYESKAFGELMWGITGKRP
jgi:hypothetical protein